MPHDADSAFCALARTILDGLLQRTPEWATEVGDHRYDAVLTTGDAEYYAEASSWAGGRLTALAAIGEEGLSPQNRVDALMLVNRLELLRFTIDKSRDHTWNPMLSNPGRAIYQLLARDFAPLPDRILSVAGRLACVPQALAAARGVLGQMPRVHLETALGQFGGTEHLIKSELGQLAAGPAASHRQLAAALPPALEAIGEHKQWLAQQLADGTHHGFRDPRLGAELFTRKLGLVLDTDRTADQILALAEADLVTAGEEIAAAAAAFSGTKAAGNGLVQTVLDTLARDAPDNTTVLGLVRAAFGTARDVTMASDLVTVFDDPVEIIEMPEIDRGVSIAYCDAPGPLERGPLPTFIAVSPAPSGWPDDRVRSFYGEYNRHMIHELVIHEGMPGHALQFQHARRFAGSTPARAMLWSGPFAEGWAVYAEHLLGSHGYPGEGNPAAIRLQRLKAWLRAIINAIMDTRVHCYGMTEAQAMALMTGEGHQEVADAAVKWRRTLVTSAQLSTYFAGFTEIADVAAGVRRAHPGWPERRVHDAILAHGSPPPRHLRALLGLSQPPGSYR